MNDLVVSDNIRNKIYTIRGVQVMIDSDLAELYDVETRVLNQAVKRNRSRFPKHFMFQLTKKEFDLLISQNVTSSWGGTRKLPYAFTEQGVSMLAGLLKSKKAIEISIRIIDAFVEMRRFLSANAQIFQRLDKVELKLLKYDEKFNQVFKALETHHPKKEGIFFNGQVFDAYMFVNDLIKSAEKSIILIDNYVDESVLVLFSKIPRIKVTIYTRLNDKLKLDFKKYNSQYKNVKIIDFSLSHDRFLIIDKKDVYHIGASLKDLGKKWFAFSKLNLESSKLLSMFGLSPS